jgi:hypothetical protein
MNEQSNGDNHEQSPNEPMLETSVDSALLLSDSMTIGELADQKPQQRNRTVVVCIILYSIHLKRDVFPSRPILHHH